MDEREKKFQRYMDYFSLTKEDLQKPLLDIGAGEGEFIQYVRDVLGNKEAYGVEMQSRKLMAQNNKDGLITGSGLSIPFKDDLFELVLAKDYLPMFVADKGEMRAVIEELFRVTKSGGKIMGNIITPEIALNDYNESDEEDWKEKWGLRRYDGAKDLQLFLEDLEKHGYLVSFSNKEMKTIVVMQKP